MNNYLAPQYGLSVPIFGSNQAWGGGTDMNEEPFEKQIGTIRFERIKELEAENLRFEERLLEAREALVFQADEITALKATMVRAYQALGVNDFNGADEILGTALADSKENDANTKERNHSDMLSAGEKNDGV